MAQLQLGGPELAAADSAELARVWGEMFSALPWQKDAEQLARFESDQLVVHSRRPGFAIAVARVDHGAEGFEWVIGQFEFIELAVIESARGAGTGRRLIEALLSARRESRVVLQTRDEELPARRLYASLGFTRLAEVDGDVLLGRELPLG